jgi:hypothetical protein
MQKGGLCSTCVQLQSCIFSKEPPILQCEEFFSGNNIPRGSRQLKTKKVLSSREAATESE